VSNPANVLQKRERVALVTQQRIVDMYGRHAQELKEVFDVHRDEPINLNQFLRGTQLAGVQIAPSDAERLFRTLAGGGSDGGTSERMDSAKFIRSLEQTAFLDPSVYKSFEQTDDQRSQEYSTFGEPPPSGQGGGGSTMNMLAHKHYTSDPPSKRTSQWNNGDQIMRQERIASEKLLRTITDAADPHTGSRPSLTLERAFAKVGSVRDGFVDMSGFQEGMSNLGVQLSKQDCRELFRRFDATEQDTISVHSFTALVCDRQRTELLGSTRGLRLQSEKRDDHRILVDAWGVPSHEKMASDYGEGGSGLQAGRINNGTMEKDVRKRLRVISPKDPESARQYLLYVFRKHDHSGRGTSGTITHKAFREALSNFDSTFTGGRAAAVVDICDSEKTGRINYHKFVDAVLNVNRARHEQIPVTTGNERSVRQNTANVEKKKERLDWSKHRWHNFQNNWVGKHGRAAVREMRTDAE
jgi:Ca2+-binding EF-hand superfamily protein